MPGYYIRSKLGENQLHTWELGKKNTFPPVYFSAVLHCPRVLSTAWSCLENLIRSHSARSTHRVSRGWEIVTIGRSMKNGACGGGVEDKNYTEMTKKTY